MRTCHQKGIKTMTLRIVLFSLAAALAFAQAAPQKTPPKQTPGAKARDAIEQTLPAGAKEIAPGVWRYTDARGNIWTYRRTPFGFIKSGEQESAEPKAAEAPAEMRAVEDGDQIRFERPTPFGLVRWTRKKTELNDVERAAWEREQKRQTSRENAEQ